MLKIIGLAFILRFTGKILSFFRVQQLANNYGENYWLDAFFIVFSFTFLFDTILISGAVATVFIPVYLKNKSKSILKAESMYSNLFSTLSILFAFVSVLMFLFSTEIALLLVKGNNLNLVQSVERLLEYFCIFPLLSLMFQLPTIYNQANGNYQLSSLNPVILNGIQLIIISGLVLFGNGDEVDFILLLVGYLLTMLFCGYLQVSRFKLAMPRKLFKLNTGELKMFSLAVVPFVIFISIEEVNLLIDQYFATSLAEGSVSNLLYASRLVKIFGAIFVGSVITVFYPKISILIARNKVRRVCYVSSLVMELLIIVTIPLVAIFYFFSTEIVTFVYGSDMSEKVPQVLSYYSILVLSSSIYMIQIRLIYTTGISKFVLVLCVMFAISNYFLNSYFIERLGLAGLAVSTVCISFMQVVLFDFYLRKKGFILFSMRLLLKFMLHALYMFALMSIMSMYFSNLAMDYWFITCGLLAACYYGTSLVINKKFFSRLKRI